MLRKKGNRSREKVGDRAASLTLPSLLVERGRKGREGGKRETELCPARASSLSLPEGKGEGGDIDGEGKKNKCSSAFFS